MSSRIDRRWLGALFLGIVASFAAAGCGDSSSDSGGSLTLYSSQHEPMTEALVEGFEEENGAEVEVRYGEDEGLASQIEQEGDASPADVFLAENTPPLELLAGEELLAEVDSSTLEEVPARYSSPTGHWVGVAARETVMVYNPDLIAADELPASILDLAEPAVEGQAGDRALGARLHPDRQRDREARRRRGREGLARRLRRQRQALQRQRGHHRRGRRRPGRGRHHQPLLLVRGGGRGGQGRDRLQAPLLRQRRPGRPGQRLRRRRARVERRPRPRPGIPRLRGQRGRPERDDAFRRLGVPAEQRRAAAAGPEALRQPRTAEGQPGGPRRRQRAGRTDAAGGPALGDGGGDPPAQRSRMGGPVALGAAGPRAHPRGPARRLRRRRPARPGAGRLPLRPDLLDRLGRGPAAAVPALRRQAARQHDEPGRGRHRRLHDPRRRGRLVRRAHRPARAAAPGRCSRRCRSPSRPSSPATAGSRSPRRCRASGAPPRSSPSPTTRSSTCRWRRCCAAWTRRWRRAPARSGWGRGGPSSGSPCRRRGSPCSAGCCSSRSTCSPSSAPSRCCASRPSPPRSTTSTSSASTAPRPRCWPRSWSCSASSCSSPSWRRAGAGATRGSTRARRARRPSPASAGRGGPASGGFLALTGLALGLPLATLVYWVATGSSASEFDLGALLAATGTSLKLGLGAAVLTTLLALPISILSVRHPSRAATAIERATYLPFALPGIVVALSLIVLSIHYVPALYGTTALLIVAYAILSLPLAVVAARAALAQAPAGPRGGRPLARLPADPGDAAGHPAAHRCPASAPPPRSSSWRR